jgi:hypothetical protein
MTQITHLDGESERLGYYSPVCNFCTRRNGLWSCEAFPDVIPDDIWFGRHDHETPFPGDNGVLFKKQEGPRPEKKIEYRFR